MLIWEFLLSNEIKIRGNNNEYISRDSKNITETVGKQLLLERCRTKCKRRQVAQVLKKRIQDTRTMETEKAKRKDI